MFSFCILLILCASAVAGEVCNADSPACSLFPNQGRGVVTLQDLTEVKLNNYIGSCIAVLLIQ